MTELRITYIGYVYSQALAHRLTNAALRSGKLIRPAHCEGCGGACCPDAHHDDYAAPLAVRWLCRRCHMVAHPRRRDVTYPLLLEGKTVEIDAESERLINEAIFLRYLDSVATADDMAAAMRGARQ